MSSTSSKKPLPPGGDLDSSTGDTPGPAKGPLTEAGFPNTQGANGSPLGNGSDPIAASEGSDETKKEHEIGNDSIAANRNPPVVPTLLPSSVLSAFPSLLSESAPRAADVDYEDGVGGVQRSEHDSAVGGSGSGVDSSRPIFNPGVFGGRLFDLIATSPAVGVTPAELELACRTSSRPFGRAREIPKKHRRAGTRTIEPHRWGAPLVRRAHEAADELLNPLLQRLSEAVCGVPGRSMEDAICVHLGAQYVLRIDIRDYFGSIRPSHLRHALGRELGEHDARLIRLFASMRHVPQGACASPAIANLVLVELDRRILAVADEGVRYTRIQDDFVVSGSVRSAVRRLGRFIERALRQMGFEITKTKSQLMYRHTNPQLVHGYVINRDRPSVPRSSRDGIKVAIHRLSLSLDEPVEAVLSIVGRIQHIKRTNPGAAYILRKRLDDALRVRVGLIAG